MLVAHTLSIGLVVGLGLLAVLALTGEPGGSSAAKEPSTPPATTPHRFPAALPKTAGSGQPWDPINGWLSEFDGSSPAEVME